MDSLREGQVRVPLSVLTSFFDELELAPLKGSHELVAGCSLDLDRHQRPTPFQHGDRAGEQVVRGRHDGADGECPVAATLQVVETDGEALAVAQRSARICHHGRPDLSRHHRACRAFKEGGPEYVLDRPKDLCGSRLGDMQFIRSIARTVTVFHRGRVLIEAGVETVLADPLVRDVYLGREQAQPMKSLA